MRRIDKVPYSIQEPKFGEKFVILGYQFRTIDRGYVRLVENPNPLGKIEKCPYTGENVVIPVLYEFPKDWPGWKKLKESLSDKILEKFDQEKRYRDVVMFKIKFFSHPGEFYY